MIDDLQTLDYQKKLSIGEAADYLGVSIDTIRRWEKKGRLVAYRSPGGHRYFNVSDLDSLFGKKYTRTQPTKEYNTSHLEKPVENQTREESSILNQTYNTQPPQFYSTPPDSPGDIAIPIIRPQPITALSSEKRPEDVLDKNQKQKLSEIINDKPKKADLVLKITVIALVVFTIFNIILLYMFFRDLQPLNPIP